MIILATYDVEFGYMAMLLLGTVLVVYGLYRIGRLLLELIRFKSALEWKKDLIIGLICLLFGILFLMVNIA